MLSGAAGAARRKPQGDDRGERQAAAEAVAAAPGLRSCREWE
ncbi:hypothetical protein J1605_017888 [Eschrichtius robustus]|uniref:Uncharacterized protein n=1 Tax=Eschrichtius robustus TaxID=9764 RepID=A0AB34HW03_ESCRO|nr:hypothetical protein J1605_017888 [Eschrichtius robustus]